MLFNEERKRWYPDGKKVIPKDFRFSPISLNIWYLGDGSRSGNAKNARRGILLCSDAFSKENLEETIIMFLLKLGIECWVTKRNQVKISNSSAPKFLEYIGECPIGCYEYKWDIGNIENFKRKDRVSKEKLESLYFIEQKTFEEMSKAICLSSKAIYKYFEKYGIQRRTRSESAFLREKKIRDRV